MIAERQADLDRAVSRRYATLPDEARVRRTAAALETNGISVLRAADLVVLLEALQPVPEAHAPAEQDRDHHDVHVVDEPMISAPIPGANCRKKASSMPPVPPGWPTISCHHRVTNIHSCSLSPAWPNGASRLCPSPVPKPSSEMEKNWTRATDMARASFLVGGQLS